MSEIAGLPFLVLTTKSLDVESQTGRIPKTVMNDDAKVPIRDFENTLSFPSEETSLDRGGFPHISQWEMFHARPAFHTVFSTTQLELLKAHNASCHHG
ncbi:MAG: hypothetical protein PVI66_05525, partial [Candidatus Aminicenantes bacterium]